MFHAHYCTIKVNDEYEVGHSDSKQGRQPSNILRLFSIVQITSQYELTRLKCTPRCLSQVEDNFRYKFHMAHPSGGRGGEIN
jgi:hypothetical protein